ncbi:MAG: hydroxyethylthiazole kinase, partial [Bacillota bacterium]
MSNILKRIVEEKPLIHHITNNVTVNDCANITLLWGGLPVMAHNPLEVEQMVERAQALVLNLGAIDFEPVTTLIKAGQKANQLGIPVIFDPVGAGATKFRTDQALKLIEKVEPAII